MKHHKHHGNREMAMEHRNHGNQDHRGKEYPGIPAHRMKYGEGIYCYLNEGKVEKSPSLEMGKNPKWMGK